MMPPIFWEKVMIKTRFTTKIIILILLFICLITVLPTAAQDSTRYTDPAERFSVPIPDGWLNESTDAFAHFRHETTPADIFVLAIDTDDLNAAINGAFAQLDIQNAGEATQSLQAPLPNGTWTQNIYNLDPETLVVLAQVRDGVAVVMLVRGTLENLAAINPTILSVLNGIQIGEPRIPPYVDETTFTEREIVFGVENWRLPGALTLPNGEGPFPLVILVHGSGPSDRDATIGQNKPFRDLAWGLASQGVAVLRYDKRTSVYGEAFAAQSTYTLYEETVEDAVAAIAYARTLPEIDSSRIFVLGHSLGGYAAPRIATLDPDIGGLILLAAPVQPLYERILAQSTYIANLDGEILDAEQGQITTIQTAVEQINALNESSDLTQLILGVPGSYWLDMRDYNPVTTATALDLPMLLLHAGRDYQVPQSEFSRWQLALSARDNVEFRTYLTLFHLFIPTENEIPSPADYDTVGFVDEAVINDIAAWILES